jgi:hypothetical protein
LVLVLRPGKIRLLELISSNSENISCVAFLKHKKQQKIRNWHCGILLVGLFRKSHKNATKCNETQGKWCKNKHEASKIIDTFETYQPSPSSATVGSPPHHLLLLLQYSPIVEVSALSWWSSRTAGTRSEAIPAVRAEPRPCEVEAGPPLDGAPLPPRHGGSGI